MPSDSSYTHPLTKEDAEAMLQRVVPVQSWHFATRSTPEQADMYLWTQQVLG